MKKTENNKLIAEFMGQPTMIWNDPDPIEGNDYRVVYFKELCDRTALIQYGVGEINSEAEVFLSELEDINLKYHTSWGWLMPVVEKIERLELSLPYYYNYSVGNTENGIEGNRDADLIVESVSVIIKIDEVRVELYGQGCTTDLYLNSGETKLKSTYKAVVEFIEWYNENK